MNVNQCEFEDRIRAGSAEGVSEELKQHVAACPACTESFRVQSWMRRFSGETADANLPAAGFLLFKARLMERQSAARAALRPIAIMKIAAAIIAGTAWIVLESIGGAGTIVSKS